VTCPLGTMAAGGIQPLQFTGQWRPGPPGGPHSSERPRSAPTARMWRPPTIPTPTRSWSWPRSPRPADDNDPGIRGPEDRGSGHRSQKPRITLDHGRPRARPAGHRSGARRVGWGLQVAARALRRPWPVAASRGSRARRR
jgi:hypothetical protein